jgi:hypothetical protein
MNRLTRIYIGFLALLIINCDDRSINNASTQPRIELLLNETQTNKKIPRSKDYQVQLIKTLLSTLNEQIVDSIVTELIFNCEWGSETSSYVKREINFVSGPHLTWKHALVQILSCHRAFGCNKIMREQGHETLGHNRPYLGSQVLTRDNLNKLSVKIIVESRKFFQETKLSNDTLEDYLQVSLTDFEMRNLYLITAISMESSRDKEDFERKNIFLWKLIGKHNDQS